MIEHSPANIEEKIKNGEMVNKSKEKGREERRMNVILRISVVYLSVEEEQGGDRDTHLSFLGRNQRSR